MDWATWEPTYRAILADFGYDPKADEEARDLLATLCRDKPRPDLAALRGAIAGREVVIAGPIASATRTPDAGRPTIATDASTWAFDRALAIVTDLDGDVAAQLRANARGVPLFVHAHGDDREALARWVPLMEGPIQPTTQAAPREGVENYGGFTDGDRACCLAVEIGARSLTLAGFDFDAPWPKAGRDPDLKRRKLAWARRIVGALNVPVRTA